MEEPKTTVDADDKADDKRWLKVFVILAIGIAVLFVAVHFTGIAGENVHRP